MKVYIHVRAALWGFFYKALAHWGQCLATPSETLFPLVCFEIEMVINVSINYDVVLSYKIRF